MPRKKQVFEGAPLAANEREVLMRLAKGFAPKEIAHDIGVSTCTVSNFYSRNIRIKLGASTLYEAVAIAVRTGVVA